MKNMTKKRITKREKVMLFILAFAMLCVAYFYFYWQPISKSFSDLQIKITEQESKLNTVTTQLMTFNAMKNEADAHQAKWQEIDDNIPAYFDQSAVITGITRITSPFTSDIVMQFDEPRTLQALIVHPVHVNLSASYGDVTTILRSFQSQDVNCRIDSLAMNEVEAGSGLFSVNFELQYLEKPEAQPQAINVTTR